jgi:hypothetical protein
MAGSTRPTWDDIGAAGDVPSANRDPAGNKLIVDQKGKMIYLMDLLSGKIIDAKPLPQGPGSYNITAPDVEQRTVLDALAGKADLNVGNSLPRGQTQYMNPPSGQYQMQGIPSRGQGVTNNTQQGALDIILNKQRYQFAPQYRAPMKDELSVYPKK